MENEDRIRTDKHPKYRQSRGFPYTVKLHAIFITAVIMSNNIRSKFVSYRVHGRSVVQLVALFDTAHKLRRGNETSCRSAENGPPVLYPVSYVFRGACSIRDNTATQYTDVHRLITGGFQLFVSPQSAWFFTKPAERREF